MSLNQINFSCSPRRISRVLMALLVSVIATGAVLSDFRTPWAVDERTHLEMIDGVASSGLPAIENGPSDDYPALRARWNTSSGGRLWGKYPPFFAYVMALPYKLGGSRAVVRVNILLLVVLAFGVYDLGRFVALGPVARATAAWVTVAATSISGMALLISPFVLASVGVVWCLDLALRTSRSVHRARGLAVTTGLVAGASVATHLLAFPVAVIAVTGVGLSLGASDQAFWCRARRQRLARWGWAVVGLTVPLGLMAVLNYVRFGLPNPLSYGPCPWQICGTRTLTKTEIGLILDIVLPLATWMLATVLVLWRSRRSKALSAALAGLSVAALFGFDPLSIRAESIFKVATALVVHVSALGEPCHHPYYRLPDALGVLFGPYAVKALLQCTPVSALALFAMSRKRDRRPALFLFTAALALLAVIVLRGAGQVGAHKLGFPFINIRYVNIVEPILIVLAMTVISELEWRRVAVILTVIAASFLVVVLAGTDSDHGLLRRVFLLRLTLFSSIAALALLAWSRIVPWSLPLQRAATLAVALTLTFSVGVAIGVDFAATAREVGRWDRYAASVGDALPQRFAIVGFPGQLDPVLVLRQDHDLEYADLFEMDESATLEPLIRRWHDNDRPAFAVMTPESVDNDTCFGLQVELVDPEIGLYRFVLP